MGKQRDSRGADQARRALIQGGAAAGALGALGLPPGLARAVEIVVADEVREVAGFRRELLVTPETLGVWLQRLHDLGPIRATGTPQCRAFEEYLASELGKLGFLRPPGPSFEGREERTIERDQYRLTSWDCSLENDCAVSVREDGGAARSLEVVSYYPFCGSTRGQAPVTGRALYAGVGPQAVHDVLANTDPATLAQAIVVVDMPVTNAGMARIKLYPEGFGVDDPLLQTGAPSAAGAGGAGFMKLLQDHCRGLVLCYTDVSNDAARYNWLPFSEPHGKIPALWVGADSSAYLKSISGKADITLRCDARLTPNARADTLVATLRGLSDETVMLTTQTDGPNECNENGGLALLALATYFSKIPVRDRRRTLVFSLPTGHYAAGAVADPVTGSGMRAGTFGVVAKRPELMKQVVAQVAMEQLGAMEWADIDGKYIATGRVAPQFWLPTNGEAPARPPGVAASPGGAPVVGGDEHTAAAARRMFMASTRGEGASLARDGLVVSGYAPGEGGVLRARGIPGIGLMGSPSYFFRADPRGVLDKLNPEVMQTQVAIFAKILTLMDRLSLAQLKGLAPISDDDIFHWQPPVRKPTTLW